ncbi:MAG: polyphosphate polymerase domain-containing protein [Clostridia bacterium]|nr:polyphosphate polymerase domain-containing protein [Clostridia bacterium]
MPDICIFKRIEKKYFITTEKYEKLLALLGDRIKLDRFGKHTICNIYLDTENFLLIRNSIDAKVYKEKLRLRSYGTPSDDDHVFLEIKKKYRGVVYKRRVVLSHAQAMEYLRGGEKPENSQIMDEIDYAMKFYRPDPAVVLCYEREAFKVKDYPNVRMTFDTNVRYRTDDLLLSDGSAGKSIIPPDAVLLEIKTDGAMPLFISFALSSLEIFPSSFSKYATAYRDMCAEEKQKIKERENTYA